MPNKEKQWTKAEITADHFVNIVHHSPTVDTITKEFEALLRDMGNASGKNMNMLREMHSCVFTELMDCIRAGNMQKALELSKGIRDMIYSGEIIDPRQLH